MFQYNSKILHNLYISSIKSLENFMHIFTIWSYWLSDHLLYGRETLVCHSLKCSGSVTSVGVVTRWLTWCMAIHSTMERTNVMKWKCLSVNVSTCESFHLSLYPERLDTRRYSFQVLSTVSVFHIHTNSSSLLYDLYTVLLYLTPHPFI